MSDAAGLLPLVDLRLDQVSASLNAATGGRALCRVDGTGGGAKYLEGRMAALLEVRRLLRRTPGAPLDPVLDRWRADRDNHLARGASAAWQEYDEGGVTEVQWLIAHAPAAPESQEDRS